MLESRKIPARTSGWTGTLAGNSKSFGRTISRRITMPTMPISTLAVSKSAIKLNRFHASAARMNAEKAFENIDQIDQKVKNKAVKNQRVQKRNDRPGLEHRLLG